MGIVQDITERKRSEETLTKLSLAVEQSSNIIVITNDKAEIEFINEAFTRTTGYTFDEVRGRSPSLLTSGQTPKEVFVDLWQALKAGKSWRGEIINRGNNGNIFVAFQIISPIRQPDGRISHYVSIMEDVTDKNRSAIELNRHRNHLEELVAERTLKLSMAETRLRLILESTADGLFGSDVDGCFTFVNPAACRLLGYTEEQLIGRPVHASIHSRRADGTPFSVTECHQHQALFTGQPVRTDDVFWRSDGQPLSVAVAGQPIFCKGEIIGTVVSFTEIGERKRVEAERETALAEAERLARVKSEFLANMSHEIRTPLNAVLGLARIGMRENQGRKSGETCGHIFAAGEHLMGIINDILDFSKIEAGKLGVESRAFALTGLTDQVISFLTDSATDKGLQLHLALADDLPDWVLGDAQRLRQILVNLLGNAIKFTEQGEIHLDVARAGALTTFCITDTGIGMNREQQERLFTAFEQADNSTTRLFGGTGLGLAISRHLARLMGGDIEVVSIPGQGSVFTLRLPLPATAAAERIVSKLPSGVSRLAGLRVLAAEDIEVNRWVLADILAQEGAQVVFAENGREAIDRVLKEGRQAFDLVLMDIQMPVMDGLEATRHLQKMAPDLPIIGLTAHALAEERGRCLEAGMVDHVSKPINPDDLVAAALPYVNSRRVPQIPAPPLPALFEPLAATPQLPLSSAEAVIDWTALSERFQGRSAFIDKLLDMACQNNRKIPEKLREAARSADYETIAFHAHSLKGICGNIEATAAYEIARQTEDSARAGGNDAAYLAERLAEHLERVLVVLDARSQKPPL
jgi:PAS domain S-box-containing protein